MARKPNEDVYIEVLQVGRCDSLRVTTKENATKLQWKKALKLEIR